MENNSVVFLPFRRFLLLREYVASMNITFSVLKEEQRKLKSQDHLMSRNDLEHRNDLEALKIMLVVI